MHAWVVRAAVWTSHFFIKVNELLGSILLLGTLMQVAMVTSVLLLKFANWFDDSFDCRTGAWNLVYGCSMCSLSGTRSDWTCCRLIIDKAMVEFCMGLQYTLWSLIYFLYIFVDVLNTFMRLCHRLIRSWNNSESVCRINILYNLAVIVKVGVIAHAEPIFIDSSIVS